jgi:hypothetical protein
MAEQLREKNRSEGSRSRARSDRKGSKRATRSRTPLFFIDADAFANMTEEEVKQLGDQIVETLDETPKKQSRDRSSRR